MKRSTLILLFIAIAGFVKAQSFDGSVSSLVAVAGKYQAAHRPEKIYLQLDKSNYNLSDTLWFKAYLFNGATLRPSAQSSLVYIEISDEYNVVQARRLLTVINGIGSGDIPLLRRDFPEGGYTLRAYTQWMRNFDENLIFKKQFFVSGVNKYKWLMRLNTVVKDDKAQLHLQINETNRQPVSNQLMQLGIKQGPRTLRWDKIQTTNLFGALDLDISLPDKPDPRYAALQKAYKLANGGFAGLSSSLEVDKNEPEYKFPIIINRAEKTDVQFMPEGGYMVAGINSVVGFKAIGEDCKSVDFSGTIVNSRNEQVCTFKSGHKGMGSFAFSPEAGMVYKAIVDLPDGTKKTYPLPEVKPIGTVLSVVNNEKSDSVTIKITATNNGSFTLLAQSRGLICYAAKVRVVANSKELKVPKSAFASGVVRFTLLNDAMTRLNERIIYIDHHDNLRVNVIADKPSYKPIDSIALHLEVKDSEGKPVQGSFSMSVVSNLQLSPNKDSTSIAANLLLVADLKGDIEDPLYYFGNDPGRDRALDELMLTQGWTSFDWKDLFRPEKSMPFMAQTDYSVSGKVINLFDKPVKGANVKLFSVYPFFFTTTKTDEKGAFTLTGIPKTDSVSFIQARNDKDGTSTYEIQLDKPDWPVFSKNKLQFPWFVNTDSVLLKSADTLLSHIDKLEKLEGLGGKILKEVTIKAKKIIPRSFNLNGPGNADQTLDEHDLAKLPKTTLRELLKQKIKGYQSKGLGDYMRHYIFNARVGGFIFDGVNPQWGALSGTFPNINELLDLYTSEDIKGIEIMYTGTFTSVYELRYFRIPPPFPVPFIEITTRQGVGPFLRQTPGSVIYKPTLAVSNQQFYRPTYPVKNSAAAAFDTRTTIHWEPNILTDKDGKATITFYAAGQPATYTITVEGSNMNGNVGSFVKKIFIK